ncbi:arylesterase [Pelagerythrobacter rhizovicinus]|uniref:Arylesterase n=1 Tax=Pelagerythrobacter rhizovicinus TaxID=2268576 RepID=A0A4Q2KMY1_9SPHN|nr:arylesterase [Pelagerythrobacter rhizovicinus]RXZ65630.1 arylesterase [Pelagerythrobacter rhizovicinus]
MHLSRLSILAALALAACGGEAPQREPTPATERPADAVPAMGPERHILAFGDSLFAGYNLAKEESYPARLEAALRAQGIDAQVANAGVSGDTTAAGLQRLAFTLDSQEETPDLVILELGGNDLLRGLSPEETKANLASMLDILEQREIPALLMGMRAPPNYGPEFQQAFDALYPALAEEYGVALVPFFLEEVYDQPRLIQPDRIHPTAEGIETLVGATVDVVAEALPEEVGNEDTAEN